MHYQLVSLIELSVCSLFTCIVHVSEVEVLSPKPETEEEGKGGGQRRRRGGQGGEADQPEGSKVRVLIGTGKTTRS